MSQTPDPMQDAVRRFRTAAAATGRWLRAAAQAAGRGARRAWLYHPRLLPPEPMRDPYATVIAADDDDLASVTGRIDTAPAMNVVLVIPARARGLREAGIWPHVAAHVRRRGIALGVVCTRRDVRGYARENGLAAARSIARLFAPARRRVAFGDYAVVIPHLPARRVSTAVIALALVVAVGFVGCVAVPSAQVVLVPQGQALTTSLQVRLSTIANTSDLSNALAPASPLRIVVHTVVSTTATGKADIPDQAATVDLTVENGSGGALTVPAGTRVTTDDGIAFATTGAIDVPPKQLGTVSAAAIQPGTGGNVKAGALTHAEGLADGVTITNRRAATGGTDKAVSAVSQDDFDRIGGIATEVLRRVAERELAATMSDSGTVFPQTVNVAILSQTPLTNVGDPADAVMMEYRAVATALALPEDTLRTLAEEMLQRAAPPGYTVLPGTADARVIGDASADKSGAVDVRLRATGSVVPELAATSLRAAIAGERPGTAAAQLQERLHLQSPPEIHLTPEIVPWQWLPRRASRISIVLGAPATPEPTPTATPTPVSTAVTTAALTQ